MNDDCCRENLALIADTSISRARVARELDALVRIHGKPACVVSDRRGSENDPGDRFPEEGHRVHSKAILSGPTRTASNGIISIRASPSKMAASSHSVAACATNASTRRSSKAWPMPAEKLALWRYDDNHVRPHSSLGNQTPAEARRALEQTGGSAPDALAQPETDQYQPQGLSL